MAALCGAGCSYCGRCTADWEDRDYEDDPDRTEADYAGCDLCEEELGAQPIVTTIGSFCSVACLDEMQAGLVVPIPDHLKGVA
jgi:hypothetical protein